MKKTLIILFCSLILFSCERGPYIKDYKIEGIGLGDSLLDYFSEEEITTEIKLNRYMYDYLSEDFGEVYLFNENFELYDYISFFVKPDDKKYIIHQIRGIIAYNDNIDKCYSKQKEIVEELSLLFKDAKKEEDIIKFPKDPSGKSYKQQYIFIFNSGDEIRIDCAFFEESLRKKNNWDQGLAVIIAKQDVSNWLESY